jgi:aminomethyltransferase
MRTLVMYDMAHVLGLIGPHFQEPFKEGADLVTGSTHKTFFGTQRGIVASPFLEHEERYELWEAVQRRAFPGSTSNHHLGTLLGLLMAAYEMNHFRDLYQPQVIRNAKAFARALKDCGLDVAGDPAIDFTETHQVIVRVGYGRGPEMANRLEENNIICNYQATPDEEGFTVAGALRLGVSEMTRFGMKEEDFRSLATCIRDVVKKNRNVGDEVKALRSRFLDLHFCFRKGGIRRVVGETASTFLGRQARSTEPQGARRMNALSDEIRFVIESESLRLELEIARLDSLLLHERTLPHAADKLLVRIPGPGHC